MENTCCLSGGKQDDGTGSEIWKDGASIGKRNNKRLILLLPAAISFFPFFIRWYQGTCLDQGGGFKHDALSLNLITGIVIGPF